MATMKARKVVTTPDIQRLQDLKAPIELMRSEVSQKLSDLYASIAPQEKLLRNELARLDKEATKLNDELIKAVSEAPAI